MKITPLDIQKKAFRKVWHGFDAEEVDAFLDQVAAELEEAVREGIALKEELRRTTAQLEALQQRERILQETLVTAQKITTDIKAQARREAQTALEEAGRQGERILAEAERRKLDVDREIAELKRQRVRFEAEIRQVVESHLVLLQDLRSRREDPEADAADAPPSGPRSRTA